VETLSLTPSRSPLGYIDKEFATAEDGSRATSFFD
jgi:hypothetical protein